MNLCLQVVLTTENAAAVAQLAVDAARNVDHVELITGPSERRNRISVH